MRRRVLVVGASGLLGSTWVNLSKSKYHIIASQHRRLLKIPGADVCSLDFRNPERAFNIIKEISPDLIINCAGMTSVEDCEGCETESFFCNATVPSMMATYCASVKTQLVHISTDHVFSGLRGSYTESDLTCPLNIYAKSKLAGELAVMASNDKALIIRTNFFGWGPIYHESFSDKILRNLRLGNKISLFTDAYYTPILMETLIKSTENLIELDISGIYNVVGNDRLSKYDFGIMLAKAFDLDESLIKPILLKERKDLVKRPLDISLDNAKLRRTTDDDLLVLSHQLKRLRETEGVYDLSSL
jgi:dTDP-4-dehydrorhamnose reductase